MSGAAAGPRSPRDRVTAEDLNVAPALLGQPLARPGRRAAAIAIDGLWIAAFNALGNAWVALALGGLLLWQRARRRAAAPEAAADAAVIATAGAPAWRPDTRPWRATLLGLALLGLGALTQGDDGEGARHAAAGEREAARAVARTAIGDAVRSGDEADDPEDGEGTAAQQRRIARLQSRIDAQRDEIQRLRSPGLGAWQARARHWLDELGEGWLWSLLYFTLLPAGWLGGRPGQTLGKRWLGLGVAELTGKPMTPMRSLKRYGGYAAGMATGGLGLVQLLWDANRQAIQDKTAHTVVLDLRLAAEAIGAVEAVDAAPAAPPLAAPPESDHAPAG